MQSGGVTFFLTVIGSVVSGVFIFLAGQVLLKFVLEPMQGFYHLKGKIADSLIYYADVYFHPGHGDEDRLKDVKKALRRQASELLGRAQIIPLYSFWAFWGLLPCRQDLFKAHQNLTGLAGAVLGGPGASSHDNNRRRKNIVDALGLTIEELHD